MNRDSNPQRITTQQNPFTEITACLPRSFAPIYFHSTENKSSPHVDWLYSAYHHTHPPLVERLRFIDGLENSKKRK